MAVSDVQTLAVSVGMSMAHDSNLRRTGDPYREPGQGAGNDPMAEWGLTIGQDDACAQMGKRLQAPQGAGDSHADAEHAPNWLARPAQARGQADESPETLSYDYYEAPLPKRRVGLTTIAAVVGLAVSAPGRCSPM